MVQSTLIRSWRFHGVRGHCHAIPWAGEEAWQSKFQRLLDEIDEYAGQGHKVSLVGASAGASAVLNAYAERRDKVAGVGLYMCQGQCAGTVSARNLCQESGFQGSSLELLQGNLKKLTAADKAKMRSYYSPNDGTVPYATTVIKGVDETRLPALRHGRAILYSLSFGFPKLIRFLK